MFQNSPLPTLIESRIQNSAHLTPKGNCREIYEVKSVQHIVFLFSLLSNSQMIAVCNVYKQEQEPNLYIKL